MPYKILVAAIFMLLVASAASADVWKWVDGKGQTHFVETNKAIYTWSEEGRTFYSDAPDHEDAVAVQLIWVAKGSLEDMDSKGSTEEEGIPGETPEQRAARETAEAYYCERATEVYDSYKNAPRLYRTNEDGKREYLSEADANTTRAESKAQMERLCG